MVTFGGGSLKGPEGGAAILKLADTAVDILPADRNEARLGGGGALKGSP